MQIPEQLRQFTGSRALVVVSGLVSGRLLVAGDGLIEEVYQYTEPKLSYSDKEGRFMQSGGGRVVAVGGVQEVHREDREARFVAQLARAIEEIARTTEVRELYLCAPRKTLALLEQRLPHTLQRRIYGEVAANMVRAHPVVILERIARIESMMHPYSDNVSILHRASYLRAARNGADTLARHHVDRALVQAMWQHA